MKYLKYYLFLFFLLLVPNCYAQEINANQYISASFNGTKNKYSGINWENGQSTVYSIGTKYNGKLSGMTYYIHYPFEANYTITITMNMADADWRNNFSSVYVYGCRDANDCDNVNYSNGTITFVSMYKIKFTFTPTENMADVRVSFLSKQGAMGNITGDTNFTLSSVLLNDPFYDTPSSGGGGSGSTTPNNQDIINNATGNTNKIIDNQNQNTQDVIENNNQNTQNIIDNQNQNANESNYICKTDTDKSNFKWKSGYYYENNGSLIPIDGYYYATDFIKVYGSTSLTFSGISGTNYHLLFYDKDFNLISANGISSQTYNLPSNIYYIKFSLNSTNYNTFNLKTNKCIYIDKSLEMTNSINDTNNYLKDDTDPAISDSALNDVFGKVHFSDPLSYLLTLPTQLINKIVSMSNSCSPIDFGTLYGVHLTMPCINLENYLGSDLWNILDIILSVGLLAVILKNFYDTISNLLTLGGEKEAKEKFSMPTPMDFLAMILGGDNK